MDGPVERVEISGATLALVLREVGSSVGDSDGLLFGRLHRRTRQNLQDGDEHPSTQEELTAIITGCCCTGTLMSFYDGAGSVDRIKLGRLIGRRQKWGGDPLIGWLVGRRNTAMRPSMREAAVSAALAKGAQDPPPSPPPPPPPPQEQQLIVDNQCESRKNANKSSSELGSLGLPYSTSNSSTSTSSTSSSSNEEEGEEEENAMSMLPCLFLLLRESSTSDQKCVQTHEYKVFQYHHHHHHRPGDGVSFGARPLVVRNVGRSSSSDHEVERYSSFVPVAPLPPLLLTAGGNPTQIQQRQRKELLAKYAEGFSIQQLSNVATGGGGIQEVEALYCSMLSKLQTFGEELRHTSQAVLEQEKLNAKLRRDYHHHL